MDPPCLVSLLQPGGDDVILWKILSRRTLGPSVPTWALFKPQSLPDYCLLTIASFHDHGIAYITTKLKSRVHCTRMAFAVTRWEMCIMDVQAANLRQLLPCHYEPNSKRDASRTLLNLFNEEWSIQRDWHQQGEIASDSMFLYEIMYNACNCLARKCQSLEKQSGWLSESDNTMKWTAGRGERKNVKNKLHRHLYLVKWFLI